VRLIHAVAGDPAVDVYFDDIFVAGINPPSDANNATEYMSAPAGDYSVALRPAGSQDNIITTNLSLEPDDRNTVVALPDGEDVSLRLLADDVGDASSQQALVRVINATEETASASLDDGTSVADSVSSGNASEITRVAPNSQSMTFTIGSEEVSWAARNYYGGVLYDILVTDADTDSIRLVKPVALARSVDSAPGSETAAATPTVEPTAVAQVEPTLPPPTTPPQPTPVPAAPAVPEDATTGRIFNLNPDANLQLREYPNVNARSLGTLPPNTTVVVNGREGPIEEILRSATPLPSSYEFVDPVGLLGEDEDLTRDQTWLYITYLAPDGGSIDAWARSDFIDVRDEDGDQVPLRDLPLVASNLPGISNTAAVTSPSIPVDVVTAVVVNLAPSANLNMRRTPDATAEVLAQLPLGTVANFNGISQDGTWAFLSYVTADGGTITGWSSTDFLDYQLNSQPTTLEELEERGLLEITPTDTRGAQTAGTGQVAVPTVDPARDAIVAEVVLDPGANLNLRRDPDNTSEVLARIPSGTQLIVTERTGDGEWLSVTYEGTSGWIAARAGEAEFVRLTFNGTPYDLLEVPVAAGE
jgi:SH3-like domain-containing protein